MSYLDEELIADLKASDISFDVVSETEHASIVDKINENVPFSGSKVAWGNIEKSINFGFSSSDLAVSRLADEIGRTAEDTLIFIGDCACDEAYCISLQHVDKVLRIFSQLPQHTYIVSKSLTWIACISFEGDLDFASLL
ncbi:hypothetical protein [Pseudomonas poae]|uniref:Uncharacterized protein n=1 Tax=Pseudomonas poae TaxID=200451 RepID=A0A2S9EJ01_9PSED|nr:hypothetical protein [Pseudomonas poae]PRA33068.1 hypothetical protein CQZ97_04100 [Pseudomonas poae]PRC15239.1 hypothetical protein CQZ99_18370 [Pseudomonas poae]